MAKHPPSKNFDLADPVVRTRPVINPYRNAAGLIANRLKWDLKRESWRSRRNLVALRDKFSGRKAVILCNGPSLLKSNLGLLNNVYCFGLNKIDLLFERSDFRPSCIVAVNHYVIQQQARFYNNTSIPLFLDSNGLSKKLISPRGGVIFLHSGPQGFARDCSISVCQGNTVTYVALQLAFHMGFTDVALIGADHNFAVKGPANKVVTSGQEDDSHFDPRYFAGGVPWQLPDLLASEVAYARARDTYKAFGRRVVNATEGGELEVFQRMTLEGFLG